MPPPSEELTLASSILTSPPLLLIMLMPMMARTIPLVSYLLCRNIAPTVEAHWNQRGRGLTSIQARFDAGRLNMVSSGSANQRWKGHRDRGARVNAGLIKQGGGIPHGKGLVRPELAKAEPPPQESAEEQPALQDLRPCVVSSQTCLLPPLP